jgi:hypothetical protein
MADDYLDRPDGKIHTPDEECARRLAIEVERLARLPTVERMLYVETEDYTKFGVDNATVKKMVEAVIKETEKKRQAEQTEQRRSEDRAAKQCAEAKRRADKETDKKARARQRVRSAGQAAGGRAPRTASGAGETDW